MNDGSYTPSEDNKDELQLSPSRGDRNPPKSSECEVLNLDRMNIDDSKSANVEIKDESDGEDSSIKLLRHSSKMSKLLDLLSEGKILSVIQETTVNELQQVLSVVVSLVRRHHFLKEKEVWVEAICKRCECDRDLYQLLTCIVQTELQSGSDDNDNFTSYFSKFLTCYVRDYLIKLRDNHRYERKTHLFVEERDGELMNPVEVGLEPLMLSCVRKEADSAARPLFLQLVLRGAMSAFPGQLLLKTGDDLRFDSSVHFIFHLLNMFWENLWVAPGEVVRAETYKIIPMGCDFGVIEVVSDADSIGNLYQVLPSKKGPVTITSPSEKESIMNRLLATAVGGYMGAFVLGIGDRHYENIMVRTDGSLLHIDFGHILGSKVFADTADFAITDELYEYLGKEYWSRFVELSVQAYQVLFQNRKQVRHWMMTAFNGIRKEDVGSFVDKFVFFGTNDQKEALKGIREAVEAGPGNISTWIKNSIHVIKHEGLMSFVGGKSPNKKKSGLLSHFKSVSDDVY